jgi:uncharacterized membrane protein
MSLSQVEALFVGLKEGVKVLFILYLLYVFFLKERRTGLFYAVAGGFFIVLFFSSPYSPVLRGPEVEVKGFVLRLTGYSFGVFYILSLMLLYHHSIDDLFSPLRGCVNRGVFLSLLTLFLTVLYFMPDITGTTLYIKEMVRLKEGYYPAMLFAMGVVISITILFFTRKAIARMAEELLDLPQIVILLALVKLFAGGIKGYAEFSLIPTVQAGITKLIHDMVHQTFVTIMVPDHMILNVTTWNFINIFFGDRFALYLSLILLFVPLLLLIIRYINAPVMPPPDITSMAGRRRYIKMVRDSRLIKAIPVMLFMVVILLMWFSQSKEEAVRLYNPEARPVIAGSGEVVIPISSPSGDLRDGRLHKFALDIDGEDVRIMIMQRGDGRLSVCLDACEICPPEGYAQAGDHLICLYCGTPIPVDTLGRSGGCNPIPLEAIVTEEDVRIKVDEIRKKWLMVKTGRSGEVLR